jgi:hypothetical protein
LDLLLDPTDLKIGFEVDEMGPTMTVGFCTAAGGAISWTVPKPGWIVFAVCHVAASGAALVKASGFSINSFQGGASFNSNDFVCYFGSTANCYQRLRHRIELNDIIYLVTGGATAVRGMFAIELEET